MEGSNGVSARGVRVGDPAALQALVDRRGPAVMAFCAQVCGPGNAARAAAEAFARFRAAVRDVPDAAEADPEALLLGATRHAAASMARVPSGPPPHGRLRSRNTETCRHVPTMLAARASHALGEADLDRLARHLDRCERCAAMGEIFRRGELAYADPSIDELTPETAALLLAALEAVSAESPVLAGHAAPPEVAPFAAALPAELHDEDSPAADAAAEAPLHVAPEPVEPVEAAEPADAPAEDEAALPVAEVAAPAELDAAALAAEPLPEHEPPFAEDDLGETMEWDNELPYAHDEHDAAAAAPAVLEGGTQRRGSALRVLLPVVVVAAFIVAALAIANVFGGDDGTPPKEQPAAVRPVDYRPVLTPLPVKVKSSTETTPSADQGTTTTGAAGTATTGAADGPAAAGTPGTSTTAGPSDTADSAAGAGTGAPSGASAGDGGATAPKAATPGGTAAPDDTTTAP